MSTPRQTAPTERVVMIPVGELLALARLVRHASERAAAYKRSGPVGARVESLRLEAEAVARRLTRAAAEVLDKYRADTPSMFAGDGPPELTIRDLDRRTPPIGYRFPKGGAR